MWMYIKLKNVSLIVINFSTDSVYLSKGEIMGFMQNQSLDISEIITETSTEPSPILLEEDNDIEELKEQRTLYSSFETSYMGTERITNLRESWSNSEKCLTLG